MRELLRQAWPVVLAALLLALIGLLRLVSTDAPRTSRRYRWRVALLSTLVGLSGGVALPGCEADGGGKDATSQQETCYLPQVDAHIDPGVGDAMCYKDVGAVEPDVVPDAPLMTCYADVGSPEPGPEATPEPRPEVVPDALPEVQPEAGPPDAGDELIMCYDPIPPDATDKG